MADTQFAVRQKIDPGLIVYDIESIQQDRGSASKGDYAPAHCFDMCEGRRRFLRCRRVCGQE